MQVSLASIVDCGDGLSRDLRRAANRYVPRGSSPASPPPSRPGGPSDSFESSSGTTGCLPPARRPDIAAADDSCRRNDTGVLTGAYCDTGVAGRSTQSLLRIVTMPLLNA